MMVLRYVIIAGAWAYAGLSIPPAAAVPPAVVQPASSPITTAAEIRSLELTDQDAHPFKLADALGRTMVLNFIFTGCGDVCPTQTADLAEVAHRLPPELRSRVIFVSISIDPEHDVPGTLRQYGDARQVDFSIARFLTGSPDAIGRIVAFFGANRPVGTTAPAAQHETVIHLIDAKGQGRMRYSGAPVDAPRLAQDLASLATIDLSAR